MLSLSPTHAVLYHSTLFKGVNPPLVERCLQQCEQRQLAAGEMLLSPSQQNDYIFIVLSGRLAVYLNYPDNAPLTHNRRWLEAIFARVQKCSRIDARPLCLIMVDVDHFKRFNDAKAAGRNRVAL